MYTVLLLIDIYLPVKFLVDTSYFSVLCSAQYICKFSETTGPTEAFHVTPAWERGKGGKLIQNDLGHLLIVIIVNPGGGAFSRDFTTNLASQCRAFSGALKIETLEAPLFPDPKGARDTND